MQPRPTLPWEEAGEGQPLSMEAPGLAVEVLDPIPAPGPEGLVQDSDSDETVITELPVPWIVNWYNGTIRHGLRVKLYHRIRRMETTGRTPRSQTNRIRRTMYYACGWSVTFPQARLIRGFILD